MIPVAVDVFEKKINMLDAHVVAVLRVAALDCGTVGAGAQGSLGAKEVAGGDVDGGEKSAT